MATRTNDALRRAPVPARVRLPLRLPRPSQRSVFVALGCVVAAALAYALARETPLFAARELVVSGGTSSVRRDVHAHLASLDGVSLVALDPAELAEELEQLPAVHAASVNRAFPHTLSVVIEEERPRAVLEEGRRAVLVSGRGRVLRHVSPRSLPRLPRIAVGDLGRLGVGEVVGATDVRRALRALANVPRRFPARVVSARATEEGIFLTLDGEVELRLGDASDLRVKIAAAGAVLRSLPAEERGSLTYVDATLPNRVVTATIPQLEG